MRFFLKTTLLSFDWNFQYSDQICVKSYFVYSQYHITAIMIKINEKGREEAAGAMAAGYEWGN